MEPWYAQLEARLVAFANRILDTAESDDPAEWVKSWLGDESIAVLSGCGSTVFLEADGSYGTYLTNLWGRRFTYFLDQVAAGIQALRSGSAEGDYQLLESDLRQIRTILRSRYVRGISLPNSGPDFDLSGNHVTYLDPTLFSALLLMHSAGEKFNGLSSKMRAGLRDKIRIEVARYTSGGLGPLLPSLRDESTIWWGVVRLLRDEAQRFRVGELEGIEGAEEMLWFLAREEEPRFPLQHHALLEATFDIHGELRTKLMIASNCEFLLRQDPSPLSTRLLDRLESLAVTHLNWVRAADGPAVDDHCHTLGLAVDVLGRHIRRAVRDGS